MALCSVSLAAYTGFFMQVVIDIVADSQAEARKEKKRK